MKKVKGKYPERKAEDIQVPRDTLAEGEAHPAAFLAIQAIRDLPEETLVLWESSFASCAIEGNRLAEICCGTLNRLRTGQPVSDRYLLGLVWAMKEAFIPKKP